MTQADIDDSMELDAELTPEQLRESGLKDLALIRKLWPFIRPQKKSLVIALVLLPLLTVAEMTQPFIVRRAIDGPIAAGDMHGLMVLCLLFIGLLVVHYTLRFFQMKIAQVASGKIIFDLRTHVYDHLQSLSPKFYHNFPIGKLVTRITADVENLSEMFSSGGIAILADLGLIFGAMIGMFVMEPRMAMFTLVMMPILWLVMEFFRRRSRRAYDEIRINMARMNAYLQENISGMEIVQLYRREEKNFSDFKDLNDQTLKVNLDSVFYDSSLSAVVELLTNLTLIFVLWMGGRAIMGNEMTFGLLVAYFQFVQMMFSPIEDVTEKYTIIQAGLASIDKIMALLNEKPNPVSPTRAKVFGRAEGAIEFKEVNFSYNVGHPVLKQISFRANPGEKVALVGPSGSGKTTTIKLISRFYDPNEGAILLDNTDIRHLSLPDLRRNIVVIQQDDFMFSRTVAENIALQEQATIDLDADAHERLLHAVTLANAREVIERLPGGFNEILQERGKNLSAGEKQLLLFARAIYHDPPILVLDEATSAIDPYTETLVQDAMERLMRDRTVVLIAHRLSTIEKADKILVLEQGVLVESGDHRELMALDGIYARFRRYQQALAETATEVDSSVVL